MHNFKKYLGEKTTLKDSSIHKYYRAIHTISDRMMGRGILNKNIYTITNQHEYKIYYNLILDDEVFIQFNERGNQMYSNALRYYNNYLEFININHKF